MLVIRLDDYKKYFAAVVLLLFLMTQINLNGFLNVLILPVVAYFARKEGLSFVENILVLTFVSYTFDHDVYTYSGLNLRLGYLFLPIIYVYLLGNLKGNGVTYFLVGFLAVYTAATLIVPALDTFTGIKFSLISVPLFLCFFNQQKANSSMFGSFGICTY